MSFSLMRFEKLKSLISKVKISLLHIITLMIKKKITITYKFNISN